MDATLINSFPETLKYVQKNNEDEATNERQEMTRNDNKRQKTEHENRRKYNRIRKATRPKRIFKLSFSCWS
jgi:hypothetical protein